MLHSGSRGIGNKIGQYFIEKAKEVIAKANVELPDRDLAYLVEGTGLFDDYWHALTWAQEYAARNRQEMLELVLEALARHLPPFELEEAAINCHHNYATREVHDGTEIYVTRKGAIRAGAGELGNHSGFDGCKVLHRSRQGQREIVLFLRARCGPTHVAYCRKEAVYPGRSGDPDRGASNAVRIKA